MFHTQQNTSSYWQEVEPPIYPPLQEDRHTDICVVGAGISGATTAYLLLKQGHQVVMIDKEPFGENESGHTSGHLSNALDEGFQSLIKTHGLKGARKALESHSDAIDLIEKIVDEEGISCDFKRIEGYLYQAAGTPPDYLEKEMKALHDVGFKGYEYLSSPPFFPNIGPAIRYQGQARIHLLKYLRGLWKAIENMGGEIYTLTKATEFGGGDKPYVKTAAGSMIYASNVVVCTNVPVNDRFNIHLKEFAYRSYVVGVDVPKNSFPDVLLWDNEEPYHFIRMIPDTRPGMDTVIIGGEDHRVGQDDDAGERFADLETWVKDNLNLVHPISMKWSGQIIEPADGLAYIGRSPGEEHVYIACSDSGHGITHGSIAGMIIRDLIDGSPNEWVDLYSPQRLNLRATSELVKHNANALLQYKDLVYLEKNAKRENLRPGEGTLRRHGVAPVALYCDENNRIHCLSAICPHLGGVVHWNKAERTWDCPCHGSRFAATGEVLNGPAISDLSPATHLEKDEIQELSDDQIIRPPVSHEPKHLNP